MAKRDLALDLFRNYKTGFTKKRKITEPRTAVTSDPQLISDLISDLVEEREWQLGIAEGTLFTQWRDIVGEEIAEHSTPLTLQNGILLIQCSSTAWATQLNLVGLTLLETIQNANPAAGVESLRFTGPQAPSWKRGLRSVRNGRGPRDTYG